MHGGKRTENGYASYHVSSVLQSCCVQSFYDSCLQALGLSGASRDGGRIATGVGEEFMMASAHPFSKLYVRGPDFSVKRGTMMNITVPESRSSQVERIAAEYSIAFRNEPLPSKLIVP